MRISAVAQFQSPPKKASLKEEGSGLDNTTWGTAIPVRIQTVMVGMTKEWSIVSGKLRTLAGLLTVELILLPRFSERLTEEELEEDSREEEREEETTKSEETKIQEPKSDPKKVTIEINDEEIPTNGETTEEAHVNGAHSPDFTEPPTPISPIGGRPIDALEPKDRAPEPTTSDPEPETTSNAPQRNDNRKKPTMRPVDAAKSSVEFLNMFLPRAEVVVVPPSAAVRPLDHDSLQLAALHILRYVALVLATESPEFQSIALLTTGITTASGDSFGISTALSKLLGECPWKPPPPVYLGNMDWVFSEQAYKDWRTGGDNSVLSIIGPPGSGASTLASYISGRLRRFSDIMLSFSFDWEDSRYNSVSSMLRSLCHQLLLARHDLLHEGAPLLDDFSQKKQLTENDLKRLLKILLSRYAGNTEIICLLYKSNDRADDVAEIIDELLAVRFQNRGKLKFIVTNSGDNDMTFKSGGSHQIRLLGKEGKSNVILMKAIRQQIDELVKYNPVWNGSQEDIVHEVCERPANSETGEPVTLLLALQRFEVIRESKQIFSKAARKAILARIPTNFGDSFGEMLEKGICANEEMGWALLALKWIAHAVRPLKERELAIALLLYYPDMQWGRLSRLCSWDLSSDINRCFNNTTIDDRGEIRLAHPSIRHHVIGCYPTVTLHDEKFDKKVEVETQEFHKDIVRRCLRYIGFLTQKYKSEQQKAEQQKSGQQKSEPGPLTRLTNEDLDSSQLPAGRAWGLLPYAVEYWPVHFKTVYNNSPELPSDILDFLNDKEFLQLWSKLLSWLNRKTLALRPVCALDSIPNIAARYGIESLMRHWLKENEAQQNTKDLQEALAVAAQYGHKGIVELLLDKQVSSIFAIHTAAEHGNAEILEIMLKAREKLDDLTYEDSKRTVLQLASQNGLLECVKMLVSHTTTDDIEQSVILSVQYGCLDVFKELTKADGDKFATTKAYEGLIPLVIERGDKDFFNVLARLYGPDLPSEIYEAAIASAVQYNQPPIVKELLNLKGDQTLTAENEIASHIRTAFNTAADNGLLGVVEVILDAVETADKPAQAPKPKPSTRLIKRRTWGKASRFEDNPVSGDKDSRSSTPPIYIIPLLHYALQKGSQNGYLGLVRLALRTLKKFPDYSKSLEIGITQDEYGKTPLHLAAESGSEDILSELLAAGFPINSVSDDGRTPLHYAAFKGFPQIINTLNNAKANKNILDKAGNTPLHLAAKKSFLWAALDLIPDPEVEKNSEESKKSPLYYAVKRGNIFLVREFLRHPALLPAPGATDRNDLLLHGAARDRRPDITEALCTSEISVDARDRAMQTALHVAAMQGDIASMEILLKNGADIDAKDSRGRTPLFRTIKRHNYRACEFLLDKGADPNVMSKHQQTALYRAIRAGQVRFVKLLLKERKDNPITLNLRHKGGWTELHCSYQNGEIAKLLLDAGGDPNAKNVYGTNPMFIASEAGTLEVVQHLVNAGADIGPAGPRKSSPLHRAAQRDALDIARFLVEKGGKDMASAQKTDGVAPLHLAIENDADDVVKYFVEEVKVELNQVSVNAGTPLAIACRKRNLEYIDILLKNGADVNVYKNISTSPLRLAINSGNMEVLERILKEKPDVNATGGDEWSALHAAITTDHHNRIAIVKMLLENEAIDVNSYRPGDSQDTPLQAAVSNGLLEIVEALLDKGANISQYPEGKLGIRLNTAVSGGYESKIREILESSRNSSNGSDTPTGYPNIDVRDAQKNTPLLNAVKQERVEMVKELLEAGANISVTDGCDRNALYLAIHSDDRSLFDTIVDNCPKDDKFKDACETAIHIAVAEEKESELRKILELVDVQKAAHRRDLRNSWTPLEIAAAYERDEIASLLTADERSVDILESAKEQKFPTCWHDIDKTKWLQLREDGKTASLSRNLKAGYEEVSYFEVQISSSGEKLTTDRPLSIGLCHEFMGLGSYVGHVSNSWALHSDDGIYYQNGNGGDKLCEGFDVGDVVGCGVHFDKKLGFMTLNGKFLGEPYAIPDYNHFLEIYSNTGAPFRNLKGQLYPAFMMDSSAKDVEISVNFDPTGKSFKYEFSIEDLIGTGSTPQSRPDTPPSRQVAESEIGSDFGSDDLDDLM
ncbi:Ankyrin-2 [Drechslerella dactyloides]|uniref:Ankyrin-2 n=1 Tax=Drechslerella dactyloides TaxID=74499 RepID=A0AAD6IXU0_DREDA|nr:Ankyrin-2 [Drechslerella dactyloides]